MSDLKQVEFDDALHDDATRERIVAFYADQPQLTLKTLVCRAYYPGRKEYIALVTRGDLKVDFDRVKSLLRLSNLRLANQQEMAKLGLAVGFVSPIDCGEMTIIVDEAVAANDSYYDGGNRDQLYRKNVNFPRDFQAGQVLPISH